MNHRALITLALALPSGLAAQSPSPSEPRDGVMSAFETFAAVFGSRLKTAFDSIPASRYDYRPIAPQQTIGYIAQHLEDANYSLCERMSDLKHPRTAKDSLADTIKARWPKDTLVARLEASLRFCDSAMARVPKLDSQGMARTLLAFETDLAEHYAQLSSYMRQLGMVPPSALPPRRRTAVDLPASVLSRYVGVYQLDPTLALDVSMRDDVLFVQSTGGATVRLWAEGDRDFFLKEIDAQLTFVRDAGGAVTGVVVHQFGRDRPAKKIR
jgi:uncharacterized damage-inducible protein DinB